MKKSIFILLLILCAVFVSAQKITPLPNSNISIKGDNYTAETGDNCGGFLSSIKIRDLEFEDKVIDVNRGSFLLFRDSDTVKINSKELVGNSLFIYTDIATLVYDFYPDRIEITAKNTTDTGKFRFVLDHLINLIKDENDNYIKENIIEKTGGEVTFIRMRGGLKISGDCRFFGPIFGCYAAECSFNKGQTAKMILTPVHNISENDIIESLAYPNIDLKLYTPQDYQVFQRESREEGYISLNGRTDPSVTELSYRITGKDLNGKSLDTSWETLPRDKYSSFNHKLKLNAGGWYKLEIKYIKNGTETIKTIDHIGIGEIILGAGQSNSTCCGQYRMKTQTGMVSNTDGVRWMKADDPLISPHDGEDIGSFWPSLGDILYEKFRVPIAVVPTGFGNTKIAHWQPNAEPVSDNLKTTVKANINLYDYMLYMMKRFGVHGFRCVLWHQGESDIDTPGYKYYNDVCDMIWASKRDTGWDVPWFIAKASFIPKKTWGGVEHYGFNEKTIQAQQKLIDDGIGFEGPNTDTLQGDYRDNNGGVHFSPKGLKKHAQMWAEFVIPYIEEQIK